MKYQFIPVFCLFSLAIIAQPDRQDWYFDDATLSNGIGIDQLYAHIGQRAPAKEIVVAILDSGTDIDHEDLKDNIWINNDEIPGNKIDDDKNGYVDDIHGWNFLGNANGQNVTKETLEVTRLYAVYRDYFRNKDLEKLSKKDQKKYAEFLEYESIVTSRRASAEAEIAEIDENLYFIDLVLDTFDVRYPGQQLDADFLASFDPGNHELLKIVDEIFTNAQVFGLALSTTSALREDISSSYEEMREASQDELDYRFNPDFKSRHVIGDNYENQTECCYGNPDVRGGFAFHGTHVAGIVGALWNDKGTNGVAKYVRLMPVRTVPNGDEHDKDVANAIRYAVDNGAHIINMSFGKGQAWNKKVVDDAVKYARKHDVLLVHGAGNDGANNDETPNYPNASFEKSGLFGKKMADNWIEVGATSPMKGENAIAPFSNYGKKEVDLFAPGMEIYSTAPDDNYASAQGTSMASPVVAGVAAVIRAYYPQLKAHEVKMIIMDSVTPSTGEVSRPGDGEMIKASELSRSGGMVNAYAAFKLAEKRADQRKSSNKKEDSTKKEEQAKGRA